MTRWLLALVGLAFCAGTAIAQAPEVSLRPAPRETAPDPAPAPVEDAGAAGISAEAVGVTASLVPVTRPADLDTASPAPVADRPAGSDPGTASPPTTLDTGSAVDPDNAPRGQIGLREITIRGGILGGTRRLLVPAFAGDTADTVYLSPRPELRPDGLEARVRAAATRGTPARVTQPGQRGQLCDRPGLIGDRLEPIPGRISGCGIAQPVRIREVDGIALTTPATVNCDAARALQDWAGEARDIVGRAGGGIANLRVVASYACRTRNNRPGARLSEHSTGNAIDIAGIGLANGQELTVLGGWRDRTQGPLLQRLHRAACGPFGTVLGPDGDRYHQDHFHFDVAGYRSGPYCR